MATVAGVAVVEDAVDCTSPEPLGGMTKYVEDTPAELLFATVDVAADVASGTSPFPASSPVGDVG